MEITPGGTRGAPYSRRWFRVFNGPVVALVRLLRGRGLRLMGQPLLLLTTVGARSGREHTVPLLWFPDGPDRWLIVASSGGMAKHPAWYLNLVKHPDQVWIEVYGRKQRVQPESLRGAEREAAWRRITSTAPNYETYQSKTDRVIPVVRLQKAALPG